MKIAATALMLAFIVPAAYGYSAPLRGGGRLTPEERFLYNKEQHGADWRRLSTSQRCERVQKLWQERRTMTAADWARLKQRMDAEWNSLSAAEKKRIEQRIATHEARKAEGRARPHRRRCANIDSAD